MSNYKHECLFIELHLITIMASAWIPPRAKVTVANNNLKNMIEYDYFFSFRFVKIAYKCR